MCEIVRPSGQSAALKIPPAARQRIKAMGHNSRVMVMEYLCGKTVEGKKKYMRVCSRSDVAVTEVLLPLPRD